MAHRSRSGWRRSTLLLLAVLATMACDSQPSPTPSGSTAAASPAGPSATAGQPASPGPSDAGPRPSGEPLNEPPVTAADRIAADRDAGTLDADTALLYRVYAAFGDTRLPERYAAGAWSEDEAGIGAAVQALESLPAAIADEIRPFLLRPTDPASALFGDIDATAAGPRLGPEVAMAGAGALAQVIPTVTCTSNGWGYVDGTAAFRVWGRCGGDPADALDRDAVIVNVASWTEGIFAAEVRYLGRDPQPDDGTVASGGADPARGSADAGRKRIDIYVTTGCVTRGGTCHLPSNFAVAIPAGPYAGSGGAEISSGFVVMNTAVTANGPFARATLAHELFHVMQNGFNRNGVRAGDSSYWFVESSAVWAQWAFAPEGSAVSHETMTPGRFEGFQDSLRPLTDAYMTTNRYWSWAWPLFMDQESSGAVASAWRKLRGQVGEVAMTRAVSAVIPFASRFRDFAVRAYNQALTPTQDADLQKLFPEPAVGAPRVAPGAGRMDDPVQLHADIPGVIGYSKSEFLLSLYAVYRPFKVDDDVGKVIVDFSGLVPQGTFDVDAIVKIKDKGWERRELPNGETTFCRDSAKDRVEEIIIVIANHDLDRNARVVGTWTVESSQLGCAPLTGVLTIERTGSFNQSDPYLEIRREHLTATVVVNMRPDPDLGGYIDAWDPANPASVGSTVTVLREWSAEKHAPGCTESYSTKSSGTWAFHDQPAGPDYENSISGFVDKTFGIAGFTMVFHYPYEVVESICTIELIPERIVHDAWICLEATYTEVQGGPDRIEVHCESDVPDMGYDATTQTIDGTLYLADDT